MLDLSNKTPNSENEIYRLIFYLIKFSRWNGRFGIHFFGRTKDAAQIKTAMHKWTKNGEAERHFRLSKSEAIPEPIPKILVNYSTTITIIISRMGFRYMLADKVN